MDHQRIASGVVAVAGGTCAGKSTLAAALLERLPNDLNVISEDAFYPDRSALTESELKLVRWDSCESIDVALFLECIEQLLAGNAYRAPRYDRVSHARLSNSQVVAPRPILVAEGLHVIGLISHWVREQRLYLDRQFRLLRVFIDCPEKVRFMRRDERERISNTISEDLELYWRAVCRPIYVAEVLEHRKEADLIIGCSFGERDIEQIIEWICHV